MREVGRRRVGEAEIVLQEGDLTLSDADAIVNAANSGLLGGGGVDGAIHRRGGPAILEECRRLRASDWPDGLPAGEVAVTSGGLLSARWVVHAVGPVYGSTRDHAALLASCHRRALAVAREKGLASIAFPAISTGVYRYPLDEAAEVAIGTTVDELRRDPGRLREVRFVLFDARAAEAFATALRAIPASGA